jgi:hypothetical protein
MIPEATTHLVISEASEDLIVSEPWTIETYAEGLIDDLFTDIDDILDGNGRRRSQTVRTEYTPTEKVMVTVPEVVLSPDEEQTAASDRTVEIVSPPPQPPTAVRLIVKPPAVTAITPKTEQKKDGWGKMLVVGITASLGTVGLLYLIQSELVRNLAAKTPQTPKTENLQATADPEKDLVNYMLQALAVIDQQQNNYQTPIRPTFAVNNLPVNYSQTTALALPSTPSVGTLPPPLTANNLPPVPSQALAVNNLQAVPSQTTNVVNPSFSIPVYQAPTPMRYPIPFVPPIPNRVSPLNNLSKPAKTEQPKVTAVKPSLPTTQPVANNQPIRSAPPKLPTLPNPPKTTTEVATQATPVQPKISAELEGLLELGDKSAALFKVDGISRRIIIGEGIGGTGWTLVEVTKGEAVIRRNGEVRSIFVGQKL